MRGSVIVILLVVCLATSAFAVTGPASGEDVEGSDGGTRAQPTVTIKLDQATKTARVEPGESGLVIFTGTVECHSVGPGSNVQYSEVALWASSEMAMRATDVGFTVVGYDVSAERVAALAAGTSFVGDVSAAQLLAGLAAGYTPTADPDDLADFDIAIISVPTPLRDGTPDLSHIERRNIDPLGMQVVGGLLGCAWISQSNSGGQAV